MIFSSFDKATDNTNFAHAVQVKPPLGRHLQKALLALLLECPCCMAPSFHGATDPLRSLSLWGISNRRYPVDPSGSQWTVSLKPQTRLALTCLNNICQRCG